MFKKAIVVMLPTNQEAMIWQHYNTKRLSLSDINTKYHLTDNLYGIHLYIVSDEEIKEGEYGIDIRDNKIFKCERLLTNHYECGILQYQKSYCRKIIATTDTSLKINKFNGGVFKELEYSLPHLSQQFIEDYTKEYNKGNVITNVLVEYEEFVLEKIIQHHLELIDTLQIHVK